MAKGSSGFSGNKSSKLPELEGTEKQVAWAEDIRKKLIDLLEIDRQRLFKEGVYASKLRDLDEKELGEDYEKISYNIKLRTDMIEKMKGIVNSLHPTKETDENFDPNYGIYGGYVDYVERKSREIGRKTKELKSKIDKSDKEARKVITDKGNKEFNSWLFSEYKKALYSSKSASWWIEHRYIFTKK